MRAKKKGKEKKRKRKRKRKPRLCQALGTSRAEVPPEFAAAWEQQLSGEGDSFEVTAETTSGFASCLKHLVLFAHLKI